MVEEIITALSRIRWLFVIARNSSFTYKGRAVDVKHVARELGVRYVLEGTEAGKDDPDTLWMAAASLEIFAGEHGVAAAAVDRALTLNPNSALAWTVRGTVLWNLDQPGPAIEAFERAMRLSPLDRHRRNFTNGIAHAHLTAGRYEEAVDWAERTLREEPGYGARSSPRWSDARTSIGSRKPARRSAN